MIPGFVSAEQRWRSRIQWRNLQRMNDVLARTPFGDRYWLFGGVLLGYAREGRLLRHDYRDADFAYDADDDDHFHAAVPALVRAGFKPGFRYQSNDGHYTEHSFTRRGAKFEFFRMSRVGDRWRYHTYGTQPDGVQIEMISEIPAQSLEPVRFIGRTWLKPVNHELELELKYGSWRVPDPTWNFLDDGSIVERRPWRHSDNRWDG